MRKVLLGRVKDLEQEAKFFVAAALLIQILVRFRELEPVAAVVLLYFVGVEEGLYLLEYALAKRLSLLTFEVEFELLRLFFVLVVLFGALLEV